MPVAGQGTEPNLFDLEGDGVTVSYSTTGIAGVPQFTYADRKRSPVSRNGAEIRTAEFELGRLVTIDIEQEPDAVTLTLILPRFWLSDDARAHQMQTIAVVTTIRTSIPPDRGVGQVQTYQALTVRGMAKLVHF